MIKINKLMFFINTNKKYITVYFQINTIFLIGFNVINNIKY